MPTEWSVESISRAMLPLLLPLSLVELGSGLALGRTQSTLLASPALLVLVPVAIGTAGNLGSVLAARLSTAFHLGTLAFEPDDETLAGNVLATVALSLTVFPVVGAGAWAATSLVARPVLSVTTVVAVATATGAVLAVLVVVITLAATYAAYRLGLDPDDVAIPVVTNGSDVLGVLVLIAVVQLLT